MLTDDQLITLAMNMRGFAILTRDPICASEVATLNVLKEIFPRLAELAGELWSHKNRSARVDYSSADDMLRLASLYTHDLALPSSTNGEVALGRCVERLTADLREQHDVIERIATWIDECAKASPGYNDDGVINSIATGVREGDWTSEPPTQSRAARQAALVSWAKLAFGEVEATNPTQRALRLLEEAIEAFQAAAGDAAQARQLVDFVFSRPPGTIAQELGGVAVTTLLLAAAAGVSADAEERREVERVLSKPIKHFTERNASKNAAGFRAKNVDEKDHQR